VLGVRPVLITGEREAELAYAGATGWYEGKAPVVVSDIGGGSTEFVTAHGGKSIDIGSVRLTERLLPDRPATAGQIEDARRLVAEMFREVAVGPVGSLLGVAGTWTELPSIAGDLPANTNTHGMTIGREDVSAVVDLLA